MTAVHRLWRFPRRAEDLATLKTEYQRLVNSIDLREDEIQHLHEVMWNYHSRMILQPARTDPTAPERCSSVVVRRISAPLSEVWSVVRRFDNPQAYKHFIRSCCIISGDGGRVGSTRELELVSGLPAASSTERLEILDDEHHILSFKVVGGQHRLKNYHSLTSLHESLHTSLTPYTIIIESYFVDVPQGNSIEETRSFVNTILHCNLQALARVCEMRPRHHMS